MMIRIKCPNCGHRLKVPDSAAGKKGKCPRCGAVVELPAAAAPAEKPKAKHRQGVALADLIPGRREADHEEWIDMTSMVDIVFFLLIFFMVTSLNSQQASIDMPVPQPQPGAAGSTAGKKSVEDYESDDDFIVVRIDADDTVWVDDAEAPTPTDIIAKLRDKMEPAGAGQASASRVLVLADGDAHHGTAVMVLDAAHEVGLNDVRLAVQEEV